MTTLRTQLEMNAALRTQYAARSTLAPRLEELRRWQAARLKRCYADLAADPRYARTVAFFIDEVYAGADLAPRDRDLRRAAGALERMLPKPALATLVDAIDLEIQTQRLDATLAEALPPTGPLTAARYATAYAAAAPRSSREAQLGAILALGRALDGLVGRPGLGLLLKLTRAPAHAAGLMALQGFLERGYAAFRDTGGAAEFLGIVAARESQLLDRLYRGVADPFGDWAP